MDRAPKAAPVVPLRAGRREEPPIARAVEARRRLTAAGSRPPASDPGRAWINGREVGGPEERYRHLVRSYD